MRRTLTPTLFHFIVPYCNIFCVDCGYIYMPVLVVNSFSKRLFGCVPDMREQIYTYNLRQRLERMDRRVNLHKQRDGLAPTCEAAAMAIAASVDRSVPLQQLDSGLIVPKMEPMMLPTTLQSVMLAAPQQYYGPATPFQNTFEPFTDISQSPPMPNFVPPPPMQLCDFPETDNRIPSMSFVSAIPASETPTISTATTPITTTTTTIPAAYVTTATTTSSSEPDIEPTKRRKTDELEPTVDPLRAHVEPPVTERVQSTGQESGSDDTREDHGGCLEADSRRHSERTVPAWVSCAGRQRRRPHSRHGRSNEGESSAVPPSQSPTDGASGSLPHLTRGLVRRGRRLLRNRHAGRRSGGRSGRRRSGDAGKDILCADHSYWTTIGELPSVLRLHDVLRSECTNVEVPSWRHKVYTSCYAMEGTENLDDEVFSKRHQRYESDERRRKRWDVQRIREQRHVEKLRQQQAARAPPANPTRTSGSHRDDCPLASLWPSPEDLTFIEIGEKLPVAAFGAPVVNFHPNEFSLPWKWRATVQEKSLRRSHHSSYAAPDSPQEAASGGGRR